MTRFVDSLEKIDIEVQPLFDRHERVALQLSGGKDSLALLHAMKPYWGRLCVYWLNPGDPLPETVELMRELREYVPNFREVAGRQREIIAQDGWPSDVVPIKWTTHGQFVFGEKPFKVQGRLDCCVRSLMAPMHEAMIADGVTCIIRGKRSDEVDKSPTRSGDVVDGVELCYPLWTWSATDVTDYLGKSGVVLPESYKYATHSLDCMSCTAWWGEGIDKFLEAKYPDKFVEYNRRVGLIKSAVADELNNCEV